MTGWKNINCPCKEKETPPESCPHNMCKADTTVNFLPPGCESGTEVILEPICTISAGDRTKSFTLKFCWMRSAWTDFGIATILSCRKECCWQSGRGSFPAAPRRPLFQRDIPLAGERAKLKSSISRLVCILFPELENLVPTLHMASVYALLSEFPSADTVANAHLNGRIFCLNGLLGFL